MATGQRHAEKCDERERRRGLDAHEAPGSWEAKRPWLDWTVGEVTRLRPLGLVFLVSASHEFGAYEVETHELDLAGPAR